MRHHRKASVGELRVTPIPPLIDESIRADEWSLEVNPVNRT